MKADARLYDPTYWQGRADEARIVAEHMRDRECARQLNDIAADYDRMATDAAKRLAGRLKAH